MLHCGHIALKLQHHAMQLQCTTATSCPPTLRTHAHTLTHFDSPLQQDGFTLGLLHLVEPVAGVRERHGHAGAHVAAGPVAVGQAGGRPLALQRGQTGLDRLAEQQHGFRQRVAEEIKEIWLSFLCASQLHPCCNYNLITIRSKELQ